MIEHHYWLTNIEDKKINKQHLQRESGLLVDDKAILLTHVSRLTWQKGIDLIIDSVP